MSKRFAFLMVALLFIAIGIGIAMTVTQDRPPLPEVIFHHRTTTPLQHHN